MSDSQMCVMKENCENHIAAGRLAGASSASGNILLRTAISQEDTLNEIDGEGKSL